jgi:hypothetical protein
MNPNSLAEYVAHQGNLLNRMATQAETLGFCLVPHGINPHTLNTRLYNFMSGGFGDLFDAWCRTHGRKYIRINTWFSPITHDGALFNFLTHWKFEVPRTKRMRPIVVALDLVCHVVTQSDQSHWAARQVANLAASASKRPVSRHCHDCHEYQGNTLATLELVISILRMPPHHAILTDTYTPREPRRS